MRDEGSSSNTLIKKIVRYSSIATGAWAPIATAYGFVSSGKLGWAGITTSLGLPQLLVNLCEIGGGFLLGVLFINLVSGIMIYLPLRLAVFSVVKDQAVRKRINDLLFLLFMFSAILITIIALFNVRVNPLRPMGVPPGWFHWTLTAVGGVSLSVIYLRAYVAVKKAIKNPDPEDEAA